MLFKTTESQVERLRSILEDMDACGLDREFIDDVRRIGSIDQGTFDLAEQWSSAVPIERQNVIIDIARSVLDHRRLPSQRLVIVEGVDRSAKSTIGKMLAEKLRIPYFKNSRDKLALKDNDFSRNMLRYCDPYFVDFLRQTGTSAVIDRHFVSEWCYSHVLGRETDEEGVWASDELFSKVPTTILIFKRTSYAGVSDDDPRLTEETLTRLSRQYDEFAERSKCNVLTFEFDAFEPKTMIDTVLRALKGADE